MRNFAHPHFCETFRMCKDVWKSFFQTFWKEEGFFNFAKLCKVWAMLCVQEFAIMCQNVQKSECVKFCKYGHIINVCDVRAVWRCQMILTFSGQQGLTQPPADKKWAKTQLCEATHHWKIVFPKMINWTNLIKGFGHIVMLWSRAQIRFDEFFSSLYVKIKKLKARYSWNSIKNM